MQGSRTRFPLLSSRRCCARSRVAITLPSSLAFGKASVAAGTSARYCSTTIAPMHLSRPPAGSALSCRSRHFASNHAIGLALQHRRLSLRSRQRSPTHASCPRWARHACNQQRHTTIKHQRQQLQHNLRVAHRASASRISVTRQRRSSSSRIAHQRRASAPRVSVALQLRALRFAHRASASRIVHREPRIAHFVQRIAHRT